jgi:2-polyprenyl-3-methyl-5-hydroxy-6-metoxy-1,4-benzoquinol methylase
VGEPRADGGERVDLGLAAFDDPHDLRGPELHTVRQHLARYRWVSEMVSGTVLDAACGTGYGSALLRQNADEVVGIDVSASAIERAKTRSPASTFICESLPLALEKFNDGAFDAIVSFETIEHVDEDQELIREFSRVLSPSGKLVISTPNSVSPFGEPPDGPPVNPFHVREYTREEFARLLTDGGFRIERWYGQNAVRFKWFSRQVYRALARWPRLCSAGTMIDRIAHGQDRVEPWAEGTEPWFWVAVCSHS